MSLETLLEPFPWARYSKKLAARIETPRWGGHFAKGRTGLRLVTGEEGEVRAGNCVRIYWLVDEEDGIVADAKHQTFGQSALIGAAEAACELACGKNYDQAGRIGADLIDKHLRDKADIPSFPPETSAHLNLVVDALMKLAEQCSDLPLPEAYVTPAPPDVELIEGGYPGFMELADIKKLTLIEQVIAQDVRPYIELDAGGIDVLKLLNNKEVIIAYQGNCTTCHAATGTTLSYIQHVLRAKVHPDLVVVPDL